MEVVQLLGSAMGLGFVSGLNLYATVLTLGFGIRFHLITLSPQFERLEILSSWYVLIAAGILFVLEAFADKIPWVDSLWDAVHTVIRPLGAAVLGATAIGSIDPQAAVIAALCAGVALTGHSAKAGTRLLVNHSPEPVSNIVLSVSEDVLAVAGTWLAIDHPLVMFVIVLVFLIAFAWFAPKVFRLMRVEFTAAIALLKKLVHYFDDKLTQGDVRSRIRCVAGKGIRGLRWSIGYLQVRDRELVFITRRSFRVRNHHIDRQTIEDVNVKKGILLDRLILRANGKERIFSLFKYPQHTEILRSLDSHRKAG